MRRFTTGVASGLCGPTTVWPGRSPQGITNNKRIRSVLVCAALSSSVGVAAQTLALSAEPPCRLKLVCVRRGSADLGAALLLVYAVDLRFVLLLHGVADEFVLRAGAIAHSASASSCRRWCCSNGGPGSWRGVDGGQEAGAGWGMCASFVCTANRSKEPQNLL